MQIESFELVKPFISEEKTQETPLDKANKAHVLKLLRYWRNSLADEDKLGITQSDIQSGEPQL